ncbi:MAG TPA: COX15/CtaA family protein [Pyrinomonadaceae bacterium]|nr:COX15/CtaA family protein [Pyrinomonadaceae bacterium]
MNKGLHRYALLIACATFCLIVAGALVTSHDAGLATSDWPLTEGKFLPKVDSLGLSGVNMVGNLYWEHLHRMVASTVGFLTLCLFLYLYRGEILSRVRRLLFWLKLSDRLEPYPGESRRWLQKLGLVALLGVIAQGLLGGLTVKLMLPLAVSAAHATLAQLFFCTTVSLAVVTSRSWSEKRPTIAEQGSLPLRYIAVAAVITIFLQLIIGATLRHSATWDKPLPLELLLTHIGGAAAVTILLGTTSLLVLRRHANEPLLTRPAKVALGLLVTQLFLGLAAYLTRAASPNDPQPLNPMIGITVAHVACGALVFATTIVLTLRAFKILRAEEAAYGFATSTPKQAKA